MKKIIASLVMVGVVLSPVSALAAAPTAAQIIRSEFKNRLMNNVAERADMDMSVNYTKAYFDKTKQADSLAMKLHVSAENFPISENLSNAEINYSLPQLTVKTEGMTMVDARDAFSLDLRVFPGDKTFYARLNSLDAQAITMLSQMGIKVEPVMGQWVRVSLTELLGSELGQGELETFTLTDKLADEQTLKKLKTWYVANELKLGSPLSIVSYGKITKNTAGERMQTVRVKINSKWYAAVEKLIIDQYKEANFDATPTELKRVSTDTKETLALIKKYADKLTVDVQVNLTTAKLSGFSVKYKQTETKYRYDYVEVKGKFKDKKVADSKDTTDVQLHMSWKPGTGTALEAPSSALDPEVAWNLIYQKPVLDTTNLLPIEE